MANLIVLSMLTITIVQSTTATTINISASFPERSFKLFTSNLGYCSSSSWSPNLPTIFRRNFVKTILIYISGPRVEVDALRQWVIIQYPRPIFIIPLFAPDGFCRFLVDILNIFCKRLLRYVLLDELIVSRLVVRRYALTRISSFKEDPADLKFRNIQPNIPIIKSTSATPTIL